MSTDKKIAPASMAQPDSVTSVMLDVVPGPDGMGAETYAKSVNDVRRKLTEMGQRIEELESRAAAARVPLTASHVMSALALCPTDLSHSARCAWIAARLLTATVQEGGAA